MVPTQQSESKKTIKIDEQSSKLTFFIENNEGIITLFVHLYSIVF